MGTLKQTLINAPLRWYRIGIKYSRLRDREHVGRDKAVLCCLYPLCKDIMCCNYALQWTQEIKWPHVTAQPDAGTKGILMPGVFDLWRQPCISYCICFWGRCYEIHFAISAPVKLCNISSGQRGMTCRMTWGCRMSLSELKTSIKNFAFLAWLEKPSEASCQNKGKRRCTKGCSNI